MVTIKSLESMIQGFVQALEGAGFSPRRVMLFGSYAKGCPGEYSDIDLAVWADGFEGARVLDIPKVAILLRPYPDIQLHPFYTADNIETNPFIEEVEATGKDYSSFIKRAVSTTQTTAN